jgi:hypothetical protein
MITNHDSHHPSLFKPRKIYLTVLLFFLVTGCTPQASDPNAMTTASPPQTTVALPTNGAEPAPPPTTALPTNEANPSALQMPASLLNEAIVHDNLSAQVVLNPVYAGMLGQTGLGYVLAENLNIPPDQRPQNDELTLDTGSTFSMFLILSNNTDTPKTFLVTALLNYRQSSFALDEQAGVLHLVTAPANTEMNLPIVLEVTEAGRNDLQVVAFDDPFNPSLDINYRSDIQAGIISRRTTIIAGQIDTPARTLEFIDTNHAPPEIGPVNRDVMFFKRDAAQTDPLLVSNREMIYTDTLIPGTPYPFQIVLSQVDDDVPETEPAERTVVVLYNYRQLAFDGRDVIAAWLDSQEEAFFNAELPPTNEPGVHQLQAVYVDDPYATNLDILSNPLVLSSFRMALVLQP